MTEEKKEKRSFENELFDNFYSLFNDMGMAMDVRQIDSLRDNIRKISKTFAQEAMTAAILKLESIKEHLVVAISEIERKVMEAKIENVQRVDKSINKSDNV